jgi:hypothetical protein
MVATRSVLIGTDGDGENDAAEGNLISAQTTRPEFLLKVIRLLRVAMW